MSQTHAIPRLIVAGTSSGVGKTTTMVALIGAFRRRGLKVACFKCGPDYLDPTYHQRANDGQAHHLDPWLMGRDGVLATFEQVAKDANIALIEGMMGLFDGLSPHKDTGSTAQLAKWLKAPVLLVVDAAAIARSLAALTLGYALFDPEIDLVGVWCNRIGSRAHLDLLRQTRPCRPVLGGLPSRDADGFSERHLGLVAAQTETLPEALLQRWAEAAESHGDLDRLLGVTQACEPLETKPKPAAAQSGKHIARLGIARDAAFSFYYEENLRLLQANGLALVPFSPTTDKTLPEVDGLYFGGGYPELHAEALSANEAMRSAVYEFAAAGGLIYAECGGFMYLGETITTSNGRDHPMVGWFPCKAIMRERLQAIGYAEAIFRQDTFLGGKGTRLRGHQFRYSHMLASSDPGQPLYTLMGHDRRDRGKEGWCRGSVCGSYLHAHWASNPMVPRNIARHLGREKRP